MNRDYKNSDDYKELSKEDKRKVNALIAGQFLQGDLEKLQNFEYRPDMLPEMRHRYLMEVKANYLHHFEGGLLTAPGLIFASETIESALDVTDENLSDWVHAERVYDFSFISRKMLQ